MFRCSVYTTTTSYCIKRRAPVKSFLKTYNLVSQAFSANVWSANDGKTITQWSLPAYNGLVIVIPAVYDKRGTPRLMCLCNLHNSRGKRRFAKFCALSCALYKSRPGSNPFSHPLSAHCWSMWTADGCHALAEQESSGFLTRNGHIPTIQPRFLAAKGRLIPSTFKSPYICNLGNRKKNSFCLE